jgi:hypothetical protein
MNLCPYCLNLNRDDLKECSFCDSKLFNKKAIELSDKLPYDLKFKSMKEREKFKLKVGGKMIKVSKNVLNEYKAIIERVIILIEDNKPLKDVSGFYSDKTVLFELSNILNDINEVLK